MNNPLTGRSVWKPDDAELSYGITSYLSGIEPINERGPIYPLPRGTVEQSLPRRRTRILANLDEVRKHIQSELLTGCGFTLLYDVGLKNSDIETLKQRYCALGGQLGSLVPQNAAGDILRFVTDLSEPMENQSSDKARGHRGRSGMSPHTDSADIAALLCVRSAKSGGSTSLCSAASIYNEILVQHPEYLKPLFTGFHFDLSGKTKTGPDFTEHRIPVFSTRNGRLSCVFNKDRIVLGMRKANKPLKDVDLAAVEYLDALAKSENFTIRFMLKPGEILFINNSYTLHGRDEYDDWPEINRKRLLLRLWVNLPAHTDSPEVAG